MAERFTLPYPPDVEDWLDLRSPYFNASLTGALFGVHPFETLGDVCAQKLTGHRTEENDAMRRGTRMEPYIMDVASDMLSKQFVKPLVLHGYGCMLATLDGVEIDNPDQHLEVKSTTDWVGAEVPRYWWYQAQSQMGCYGSRETIFAYLDGRLEVQIAYVEFDEREFERIMNRAEDVMAALHIGEVPGGIDLSADNIAMIHPVDDGQAVALPDDAHAMEVLLAYQEASEQMKQAEAAKREARDQLVRWLGSHSVGMAGGLEVVSFKAPKPSRGVNVKRLLADHPELVETYTEDIPNSRRIHITKRNVIKVSEKVWPQAEQEEAL
ncbi:MAG TPA: YqaJ viral recombinase family protein [Sporichthya sp.]|nr:YqaJ viral recombinase family protein [Sporichthya sp.]